MIQFVAFAFIIQQVSGYQECYPEWSRQLAGYKPNNIFAYMAHAIFVSLLDTCFMTCLSIVGISFVAVIFMVVFFSVSTIVYVLSSLSNFEFNKLSKIIIILSIIIAFAICQIIFGIINIIQLPLVYGGYLC